MIKNLTKPSCRGIGAIKQKIFKEKSGFQLLNKLYLKKQHESNWVTDPLKLKKQSKVNLPPGISGLGSWT